MTGATAIKEDIALNGFNHITAELFEHPLSLPEHDENEKEFTLPGKKNENGKSSFLSKIA